MGITSTGRQFSSLENYTKPIFCKSRGNKTIVHFNLQLSEACLAKIKNFPLFYQQLIQISAKVSKRDPTQTSDPAYEICKEVLWNNSCITFCIILIFTYCLFVEKKLVTIKHFLSSHLKP